MDEKTLNALKESIKHWERLATGNRLLGESIGSKHCALCELFNTSKVTACEGCPVKEFTDCQYCVNTPYKVVRSTFYKLPVKGVNRFDSPAFKKAAQKELDFLKSLLPPEFR